ncbi:MAG: hypothetical protein H0T15_06455 [Thermoleophilaceae bacterium]|nr:hypothetical protein [Thermoleophilaceae bacterium]
MAPYQTVCNYWNLFWNPLATHLSYGTTGGTYQRVLSMTGGEIQDNRENSAGADRPADFPAQIDIKDAKDPIGDPLMRQFGPPYQPAIDGQGNADCQAGQTGGLNGPLTEEGRYPPANGPDPRTNPPGFNAWQDTSSGGSHVLSKSDFPGLAGPTFTGVKNLRDVP